MAKVVLTFVLLQNPLKYTYPALVGRSIKEFDYHGVDSSLLEEALDVVPAERWKLFCNQYIEPNEREAAIDAAISQSEVEAILADAKATIDLIKTAAQLDAEEAAQALLDAKAAAKAEIESYKSVDDYRTAEGVTYLTVVDNAKTAIDGAESIEGVNEVPEGEGVKEEVVIDAPVEVAEAITDSLILEEEPLVTEE